VQTLMTTRKGTAVKEATPYVRTLISEDLPADDAPALRVDLPYGDDYGNKSAPSFLHVPRPKTGYRTSIRP